MADSSHILFPTLIPTEEGEKLLARLKETYPNSMESAKKGTLRQVNETFHSPEADKRTEMLRDECYEVVATIMAGSVGIVPDKTGNGHSLLETSLTVAFVVEAVVALSLTEEFSHVNETDLLHRSIHAQMHSSGIIGLIRAIATNLTALIEEEHIDKMRIKH